MKKIAIMQPYIFPYIGYFQLMNAVDEFIVYDNIQYTKKGWINRNRILVNGKDEYITLPLKKDSDYLEVKDRYLSTEWETGKQKMLNKIMECYRKAPHFKESFPIIEACINYEDDNLFRYIFNSLKLITEYLGIHTPLVISSSINADHSLKAEQKVIALCKAVDATHYINPIGGLELYLKPEFESKGITLSFLKTNAITYPQLNNEFVPFLSIIDVMMFNSKEQIRNMLMLFTQE